MENTFDNIINNVYSINTSDIDYLNNNIASNNSFSIFSINIRSTNANFDNLIGILETIQNRFSVILLSETWLLEEKDICLNGYQKIHLLRILNKSDGLSVYIKNEISIIGCKTNIILYCNFLELILKFRDQEIKVIGIYRSPNNDVKAFLNNLAVFLETCSSNSRYYVYLW